MESTKDKLNTFRNKLLQPKSYTTDKTVMFFLGIIIWIATTIVIVLIFTTPYFKTSGRPEETIGQCIGAGIGYIAGLYFVMRSKGRNLFGRRRKTDDRVLDDLD